MKKKAHDTSYSSVVQGITLACVTSVIAEGEGKEEGEEEGENVTKKKQKKNGASEEGGEGTTTVKNSFD